MGSWHCTVWVLLASLATLESSTREFQYLLTYLVSVLVTEASWLAEIRFAISSTLAFAVTSALPQQVGLSERGTDQIMAVVIQLSIRPKRKPGRQEIPGTLATTASNTGGREGTTLPGSRHAVRCIDVYLLRCIE